MAAATFSAFALSVVQLTLSRVPAGRPCLLRYLSASVPLNLYLPYVVRLSLKEISESIGADGGGEFGTSNIFTSSCIGFAVEEAQPMALVTKERA